MNQKNLLTTKTILEIIGIVVVVVAFVLTLQFGVIHNRESIDENCARINTTELKTESLKENMAVVRSDIRDIRTEQRHIADGVDEIKQTLRNGRGGP